MIWWRFTCLCSTTSTQDEPQRDSVAHMWFATPTSKMILAEALRASWFGGTTADAALATAVWQWGEDGTLQVARHRFMQERPCEAGGACLFWHNSEGTSRDQQVHQFREHVLWMVDEDGWYSNPEGSVSPPALPSLYLHQDEHYFACGDMCFRDSPQHLLYRCSTVPAHGAPKSISDAAR